MSDAAEPANKPTYRADIDGLRAIAVLAVVIHHLDAAALPSGFLGVDVFFVISGYVVTSSLSHRPASSWADYLWTFYARRIRRLMPALLVCVGVTSVVGVLVVEEPVTSLQTGGAALFGVANLMLFRVAGDYFGQGAGLNLFTHTWSLGVEEQFYLGFPVLLALCGFARQPRPNGWRNAGLVVSVCVGLSLVGYLLLRSAWPTAAFYLTPVRFWELGVGCLAFIATRRRAPGVSSGGALWTSLCATLVVVILALQASPRAWQSATTVAVVVATALALWALNRPSAVARALASRWWVRIGVLSYSLYLWHWSVVVLARYTIGDALWTLPTKLILMFGMAITSYLLVERRLRHAQWASTARRTVGLGLLLAAAVGGATMLLAQPAVHHALLAGPSTAPRVPFKGSDGATACRWSYKHALSTYDQRTKRCTLTVDAAQPTLFAVGDSHAEVLGALMLRWVEAERWNIDLKVGPGCLFPVPTEYTYRRRPRRHAAACRAFQARRRTEVLSRLKAGDLVLLVAYLDYYLTDAPLHEHLDDVRHFLPDGTQTDASRARELWAAELSAFAAEVGRRGGHVVVLAPHVSLEAHSSTCRLQPLLAALGGVEGCSIPRATLLAHRAPILRLLEHVEGPTLSVWDALDVLCPVGDGVADGQCDHAGGGRTHLYADHDHLSGAGARALYPSFRAHLEVRGLLP